jgi:FtsH-binding integral membrane protein
VKLTRPRDLLAIGLLVAIVAQILFRLSYASLPDIPLLAGATLAVLAVVEALVGRSLRARIRRDPGTEPVDPLAAARAVMVAKASAVAGAAVAGIWLGLLVIAAPRAGDITAAAGDTAASAVGLVSALALVGAALWLEHCCRAPDDPDEQSR